MGLGKVVMTVVAAASFMLGGCDYMAKDSVKLRGGYTCAGNSRGIRVYKDGVLVAKRKGRTKVFYDIGDRIGVFSPTHRWYSRELDEEEAAEMCDELEQKLLECDLRKGTRNIRWIYGDHDEDEDDEVER